eukprot:9474233-Pyramimonas_sp.AAC.4
MFLFLLLIFIFVLLLFLLVLPCYLLQKFTQVAIGSPAILGATSDGTSYWMVRGPSSRVHCASKFTARGLAHMIDPMVSASRRVE